MRILAIAGVPIDSPRAHAINVVKTVGGFARMGHETLLMALAPEGISPERALHDLHESALRCWLLPPAGEHDGCAIAREALRVASEFAPDLVYARHFLGAIACAAAGLPTVLETHAHRGDPNPSLLSAFQETHRSGMTIVTISDRLRDDYVQRGADPARVHVVPDGVDLDLFSRPDDPGPSPLHEHGISPMGRHVLHAGHLYDYKGVPTMLDAAALRPGVTLHLLGGMPADIERVHGAVRSRMLENVRVHGRVAHACVPAFLWHADALLLVPSALEASKDWTSPVKLGEYLASESAIVCSDIPALRDWVPNDLVEWARPDDPASLARAIDRALALGNEVRADRACRARALARRLCYPARARAILGAAQKVPALARPSA